MKFKQTRRRCRSSSREGLTAARLSISFKLGGHLPPEPWLALAAVIAGESLSIEWDGPAFESSHRTVGEPLELFANEVAWGKVEPLETFCQDHGLPYRFWAGGFFAMERRAD